MYAQDKLFSRESTRGNGFRKKIFFEFGEIYRSSLGVFMCLRKVALEKVRFVLRLPNATIRRALKSQQRMLLTLRIRAGL